MFSIESEEYGYRVVSSGCFDMDQIEQLKLELLGTLAAHDGRFSLLLDSREIIPPSPEVMHEFWDLHIKVWELNCQRIMFVVGSPDAMIQVKRMQQLAPGGSNDRVIDSSLEPDWESKAVAWLSEPLKSGNSRDETVYNS